MQVFAIFVHIGKTVFNLLYKCASSPPTPVCGAAFLKQGEDTPDCLEHRTLKSQNLSWMVPLRVERPILSFLQKN